ncbi:hypothetical protein P152DRAFT_511402, partial [Eremomyces bilateralis CBS 781.70]
MGDYHNPHFGHGSMPYAAQNSIPFSQPPQQMFPQQHAMQMPQQHSGYTPHPNQAAYQHSATLPSGNYGQPMPPFPNPYWGQVTQTSPITAQSQYQTPPGYGMPFPIPHSVAGYAANTPAAGQYQAFSMQNTPYAQQHSQMRSQAPQNPTFPGFPSPGPQLTPNGTNGQPRPRQDLEMSNVDTNPITPSSQHGKTGADGWGSVQGGANEPRTDANLHGNEMAREAKDASHDALNAAIEIEDNEAYSPSLPPVSQENNAEMQKPDQPTKGVQPSSSEPADVLNVNHNPPYLQAPTSQVPASVPFGSTSIQSIPSHTNLGDPSHHTQPTTSATQPGHAVPHPDWVRKFVNTLAENGYSVGDMAEENPPWTEFEIAQLSGLFDEARVHLAQAKARVAAAKLGKSAPKPPHEEYIQRPAGSTALVPPEVNQSLTQNAPPCGESAIATDLPGLVNPTPEAVKVNNAVGAASSGYSPDVHRLSPSQPMKTSTTIAQSVGTTPEAAAAKRQEYIQKLLALKKKKAAGSNADQAPPSIPTPSALLAELSEESKVVNPPISTGPEDVTSKAIAFSEAERSPSVAIPENGALSDAVAISEREEKKRKQTELARQRLEAHLLRQKAQGTPKQAPAYSPHHLSSQVQQQENMSQAPVIARPASSMGAIPGLSLSETFPTAMSTGQGLRTAPIVNGQGYPNAFSSPIRPVPGSFSVQSSNLNKRRRPVASDFDDIDTEPLSKRPSFTASRSASYGQVHNAYGGYDPHERMIIDLSDDEDEDEEEEEGEVLEDTEDAIQDSVELEAAVAGLIESEMRKGANSGDGLPPPPRPLPALSSLPTVTRSRAPLDTPPIPSGSETPNVVEKEQEIERLKREIAAKEALMQAKLKAKSSLKKPDAQRNVKSDPATSFSGRPAGFTTTAHAERSAIASISPRISRAQMPSTLALSDSHAHTLSPSPYRETSVRARRKEELQRKMQQLEDEERRRREEKDRYLQELMQISDDSGEDAGAGVANEVDNSEGDASARLVGVPLETTIPEAAVPEAGPAFEAIPGSAESVRADAIPTERRASEDDLETGWEDQDLYEDTTKKDDSVDGQSVSSAIYDGGEDEEMLYDEDDRTPPNNASESSGPGEAMDLEVSEGEIMEDDDTNRQAPESPDDPREMDLPEIVYGAEGMITASRIPSASALQSGSVSKVSQEVVSTLLHSGSAPMEESSTESVDEEEDFYDQDEQLAPTNGSQRSVGSAAEEDDSDDYDPEDIIGDEAALSAQDADIGEDVNSTIPDHVSLAAQVAAGFLEMESLDPSQSTSVFSEDRVGAIGAAHLTSFEKPGEVQNAAPIDTTNPIAALLSSHVESISTQGDSQKDADRAIAAVDDKHTDDAERQAQEALILEAKRAERNALLRARLEALRQNKPSSEAEASPVQRDIAEEKQAVTDEVQIAAAEPSATSEASEESSESESEESEDMDLESVSAAILFSRERMYVNLTSLRTRQKYR